MTADKKAAVWLAPDPPRRTTPKLFRQEAIVARRETWLGHVQLVQPVSTRIAVITTISFLAAWLMIAMTACYTRRVHTSGVITPSGGLMTITTPAAGIVSRAGVEGQKVSAGQVLYVIDRDANSVDGPTQQQVISALIAQRVALRREYSMRQSIAQVQRRSLEPTEPVSGSPGETVVILSCTGKGWHLTGMDSRGEKHQQEAAHAA